MISMLRGVVAALDTRGVTLDVHGVGYEVVCSNTCLSRLELGVESTLVIHTEVREDSIKLYGFNDSIEKHVFLLLIQVKGLGAKSASDIVSRIEVRELLKAIGQGDTAKLQSLKGVGKKTAERIVLELRDKVAEFALESNEFISSTLPGTSGSLRDAVQALQALGIPQREAERAVAQAGESLGTNPAAFDSSILVRESLKFI